jgi:hypothetical protein
MLSYTIDKENSLSDLLNTIDKKVEWTQDVVDDLKKAIYGLVTDDLLLYGKYDIRSNGITFINLIVKSDDPDIMVCDYPSFTIESELSTNMSIYKIIAVTGITVSVLALSYLYFCRR